ncbi:MAG TPA: hypothetical protein VKB93_13570 [Thermoanaerobaculia bacterium]|nr:hypothetical protein [Thermoanaerobaculia bacterium]
MKWLFLLLLLAPQLLAAEIASIVIRGAGHTRALDQTERSDRGVLNVYFTFNDTIDLAGRRARRATKMIHDGPESETFEHATPGGSVISGTWGSETWSTRGRSALEEWIELNPIAIRKRGTSFTLNGAAVTVTLDRDTNLPSTVRLTRPFPADYYNYWGDVTTEYRFSFWSVFPPGVLFPTVIDVYQNGELQRSMSVDKLLVNAPIDEASMTAPAVKDDFHEQGPVKKIADGIHLVPGRWNSTIVVQPDGIVIVEAADSSERSLAVLDAAMKLAPDKPVKAVIATGNMPHYVGGIREYVARGIPIYAVADTAAMIRRIAAAPHRMQPDGLTRRPRDPLVRIVSSPMTIGSGPTRIELVPLLRQFHRLGMLLPEYAMLYASDIYIPSGIGERLAEGAGARPEMTMWLDFLVQHPAITSIYGMHMQPTAVAELRERGAPILKLLTAAE